MNKKILLYIVSAPLFHFSLAFAQSFPIKEWTSAVHDKPLIFYITGDGGFNEFSTALCKSLNKKGYDVFALDAKSYFYNKKTPDKQPSM